MKILVQKFGEAGLSEATKAHGEEAQVDEGHFMMYFSFEKDINLNDGEVLIFSPYEDN